MRVDQQGSTQPAIGCGMQLKRGDPHVRHDVFNVIHRRRGLVNVVSHPDIGPDVGLGNGGFHQAVE